MFPFKEYTAKETGIKHHQKWDAAKANAKLQQINQEEIAKIRLEDVERARAQGIDIDGDRLPVMVEDENGQVYVDPHRSKIHHAGVTLRDRVNARWRQFCSVPQNDDGMEYPSAEYIPKEGRKSGARMDSAVSVKQDTEKRRPGRPRKQEMSL